MTPTSSRGASGESVVTQRPPDDTQQGATVEMSEDDLRRKTKSIVDEYLHLNDLKVLIILCFKSVVCWLRKLFKSLHLFTSDHSKVCSVLAAEAV